jgi:Domain of unknown function (DUF6089)
MFMRKIRIIALLLILSHVVIAQEWLAEFSLGVTAYNGDLTQKEVSFRRMRPSAGFNLKYNTGGLVDFRAGFLYGKITADDKYNAAKDLKARNLNFTSQIFEANVVAELNLFDPDLYNALPYFFGGIGIFYFNPYSYDKDHKKTYLKPLSTEGEGLAEYPNRKKYALIQPCIPAGLGWKIHYKEKFELTYELGFRVLFTDYLDDVSKTYADIETLVVRKGIKSAEFAYRKVGVPFREFGEKRGNSERKDVYFFTGFKLGIKLQKSHKKSTAPEEENY